VRDDRKDYEAVKADYFAKYKDGSIMISEKRLDKHGNEVLDNNGNVIIDSSDFLAAYQKGEADPVRQIEMEEAVAAHRLKLFGNDVTVRDGVLHEHHEPDPVQLPGQGTIFVSTFGRRTKEYLKYIYGEGGIYEQLQELKMPAEEVLTKALTFLDPLVPGKQTTVSIKSFDPPSVKESRARARAAAKRSDALEAGIKQELKDYFGWLQRFAKDIDEDVERSTRSVPGAYMWVTDETGERKKKCVGVQKIYRSEKDRTLLKQKLAMKTPDFYWRNLDEMKAVQLDKNTGQLYGPYWRKRAEKGTFKMRERERQYKERMAENLKRIENADSAACVEGSHVEGSENYPPLRLTCEQKIVTPYVEAEPSRRGMHNARSQARKDKMREDTRDHFKSMQRLKDMSFREHVKYERKKQAASAPSL